MELVRVHDFPLAVIAPYCRYLYLLPWTRLLCLCWASRVILFSPGARPQYIHVRRVEAANTMEKEELIDIAIAAMPCDIDRVPVLVAEISSTAAQLSAGDGNARLELVEKARSLVRALETPRETMIKHCWAQVGSTMTMLTRNYC